MREDKRTTAMVAEQSSPVLRHLAFGIFACPANSAADERTFSMAGNVLNEARYNTQAELAEAYQGLRSWFAQELT